MIREDQVENFNFYESYDEYIGKVDPQLIKGIEYAFDYNYNLEINWIQLLNSLRRFDEIRQKHSTYWSLVDHVHRHIERDPSKLLFKFGNTYITRSGQHRMALAKFLEVPEVEVTIREFKFNHEKYNKYLNYKRQIKELVDNAFLEREESSFGKDNHFYYPTLSVAGKSVFISEEFIDGFLEKYREIKTYGWLNDVVVYLENFPGNSSSSFQVVSSGDFSNISHLLRLHKFQRKRS